MKKLISLILVAVLLSYGLAGAADLKKIPKPLNKLKDIAIKYGRASSVYDLYNRLYPDKKKTAPPDFYTWEKSVELLTGDIATYRIGCNLMKGMEGIGFSIVIKDPIEFRVSGSSSSNPKKSKYIMEVGTGDNVVYHLTVYRDENCIRVVGRLSDYELGSLASDFLQEIQSRALLK